MLKNLITMKTSTKMQFSPFEIFKVRKFGKLIHNNYNCIVMRLLRFRSYRRDLSGDLF